MGVCKFFFRFFDKKCPKKKFLTILFRLNDSFFNDNYDNEDRLCIAISISEPHPGVLFIFFDGCAFLIYPYFFLNFFSQKSKK